MNSPTIFESGMTVVCRDDQDAEKFVIKNQTYRVTEVNHRGALLKLRGVQISLASSRFAPVSSAPSNAAELANASGQ